MSKYVQGHGYLTNLESIENEGLDYNLVLSRLALFAEHGDPDMHEWIYDMHTVNLSGDICPNLMEY